MDIAQFNMVEQQIRPWNVHDPRLLKQMSILNRSAFVPRDQQALCWMDTMIALEDGTRMLMPKTAARLIQALELVEADATLMVGAGSGYTLALCAALSKSVDCVDSSQHHKPQGLTEFKSTRPVRHCSGISSVPNRSFDGSLRIQRSRQSM